MYPLNSVLFIVFAASGVALAAWLVLRLRMPAGWSRAVAAVLLVWLAASLWLAVSGNVQFIPNSLVLILAGSALGTAALGFSKTFRDAILATPAHWLIAIHTLRIAGFAFVALLDMGRLPAQFALPAGYGDMTVGVLALATSFALATKQPYARGLAIAVNLLGLLDFVTALSTGLSSLNPFAQQLLAQGISPTYLSYVLLIPTFAVPVLTLFHTYSLYQLIRAGAARAVVSPNHGRAFARS